MIFFSLFLLFIVGFPSPSCSFIDTGIVHCRCLPGDPLRNSLRNLRQLFSFLFLFLKFFLDSKKKKFSLYFFVSFLFSPFILNFKREILMTLPHLSLHVDRVGLDVLLSSVHLISSRFISVPHLSRPIITAFPPPNIFFFEFSNSFFFLFHLNEFQSI